MSNKILQSLTAERIKRLELSFTSSKSVFWDEDKKTLLHAGEYGVFRERAVQELLRLYTPEQFGIGSGFVITNQGDVSTQCDIIVYDRSKTAGIVTDTHQSFFPIETVVAIGEVKSTISNASVLNEHLSKLAATKSLRERIINPSPYRSEKGRPFEPAKNPFDQIFTFLICHKLNFKPTPKSITYDQTIAPRFRHNLVISIQDGIFCYFAEQTMPTIYYPAVGEKTHENKWIPATTDEVPLHFCLFLSSFYNAMNAATLLEPDMVLYLTDKFF